MPQVRIEKQADVTLLHIENGITNAIGPTLVDELAAALAQIRGEARGLVVAGSPKFFSIGFDLPHLISLGRDALAPFIYRFNQLVLDLYTFPAPVACALAGHAVAGGAILALAGDYRFGAVGHKLIGLNEVQLGLPVPYLADQILRQIAGDRAATELMYSGALLSQEEGRQRGLIDDLGPAENAVARAVAKIAALAQAPAPALARIKANRTAAVRMANERFGTLASEQLLDMWFTAETQSRLRLAAAKFSPPGRKTREG